MTRTCSYLSAALILTLVFATASSAASSACEADKRTLFLKALGKIDSRMISEQSVRPEDATYEKLLPALLVGKYFRSFSSAEAFLEANPDCCRLHHDLSGFELTFDPNFFESLLPGLVLSSKDVIVVQIDVRVEANDGGTMRKFKSQYEVVLDRCARDLDVGRFDVTSSGPIED